MKQIRHVFLLSFALLTNLTAACSLDEVLPGDGEDLAKLSTYRSEMRLVSVPYRSDLAPNPQIDLWIDSTSAAAYQRIRPDIKGSKIHLPEGTVIVREVLDAQGKIAKLTVMGKGPLGSNPVIGDWWFAVTTPTGTPLEENGQVLSGKLAQCVSCHDGRGAQDDYLFGVPVTAQKI